MSQSSGPEDAPKAHRERVPRKNVYLRGLAVTRDGTRTQDCKVEDASEAGARITGNNAQQIPEHIYLIIAGREIAHEAVVVWSRRFECGLKFEKSFTLDSIKNTSLDFLRRLKIERLRG